VADLISWTVNGLLAAVVVACACAFDKMSKATDNAVRWAMVFIGVGALGQLVGNLVEGWDQYLDLLIFGGLAAFLYADRRGPFGVTGLPRASAQPAQYAGETLPDYLTRQALWMRAELERQQRSLRRHQMLARAARRTAVGLLWFVGVVVTAAVLSGCAALPPCPMWNVSAIETPRGVLFIVDEENMERLAGRMRGIQNRTCEPTPAPPSAPAPDGPAAPAAAPSPPPIIPAPEHDFPDARFWPARGL
jgi:uncharacterized membrane protein